MVVSLTRYPLAIMRIVAFALVLLIALVLVLITSVIRVTVRGVPLATWLCTAAAQLALWLFGVRTKVVGRERLRAHTGLIFANHCTFIDILLLISVAPVRFLSAAENKRWPVIGLIAQLIGTVFVDRANKDSRKAARDAIVAAAKFPPIVIFPEGGISPAGELRPFRYGGFEMCIESGTVYLPCVIKYDPQPVMLWNVSGDHRHEPLLNAVWRIASYTGVKTAVLVVFEPVTPSPGDDAVHLATAAHRMMAEELGWPMAM